MYDFIIVGTGPAGVWAGYGLQGKKVLFLSPQQNTPRVWSSSDPSLEQMKKDATYSDILMGSKMESLNNLFHGYLSPKLKSPQMKFVAQAMAGEAFDCDGFEPIVSYANGGLANAWGAGAYEFSDQDLRSFPYGAADLQEQYELLTQEIGVAGAQDDLSASFSFRDSLLPPLPLARSLELLLQRYQKKNRQLNSQGLRVGHGRLAILSRDHQGRPGRDGKGLDFFLSMNPSVYNPQFTLERLLAENAEFHLHQGALVQSFAENSDGVSVQYLDLKEGKIQKVLGRNIILAAGALNTSKIVLSSFGDYSAKLPLLDNPISLIPLFSPKLLGKGHDDTYTGAILNSVYESAEISDRVQLSIYNINQVLQNDILGDLPLAFPQNIAALKALLPAMVIAQVFYPDAVRSENFVQLRQDGRLKLKYEKRSYPQVEKNLIGLFGKLGFFSHSMLVKRLAPGNSIHYAGMLGMTQDLQKPYGTDAFGKLNRSQRVFIADSAAFPDLPAKNFTFTIMAHALRLGQYLRTQNG